MNEKRLCATLFTSIGAFVPGVPVQPVLIRYPNKLVSMTSTKDLYCCHDASIVGAKQSGVTQEF